MASEHIGSMVLFKDVLDDLLVFVGERLLLNRALARGNQGAASHAPDLQGCAPRALELPLIWGDGLHRKGFALGRWRADDAASAALPG